MPVTIETIKEHAATLEWKFDTSAKFPNEIRLIFSTDNYKNQQGEMSIILYANVSENSDYLEVYAEMVENISTCRFKGAVLAAAGEVMLQTRHTQIEYNPKDGDIRVAVDIPVFDSVITAKQFSIMVNNILFVMDTFQPVMKHAMETGQVDMSKKWSLPEEEDIDKVEPEAAKS